MTRKPAVAKLVLLILLLSLVVGGQAGCGEAASTRNLVGSQPTVTTTSSPTPSSVTTARPTTTTAPQTTTTTPPSTTTTAAAPDALSWQEAGQYVGEWVTLKGPVVGTKYAESSNGSPTFLNVGRDYPDPDRLTILIWGGNRDSFSSAPEDLYAGRTIRVQGEVSLYRGAAQIEVSGPSQIEIID